MQPLESAPAHEQHHLIQPLAQQKTNSRGGIAHPKQQDSAAAQSLVRALQYAALIGIFKVMQDVENDDAVRDAEIDFAHVSGDELRAAGQPRMRALHVSRHQFNAANDRRLRWRRPMIGPFARGPGAARGHQQSGQQALAAAKIENARPTRQQPARQDRFVYRIMRQFAACIMIRNPSGGTIRIGRSAQQFSSEAHGSEARKVMDLSCR